MKTPIFLAALIATVGLTSCYSDNGLFCTNPSGEMTSETRDVNSFDAIDLMMSADVVIEPGEEYEVIVDASENIIDLIQTKVSGRELNIKLERGECIRGRSDVTITVKAPNLEEIKISGSGNVTNTKGWSTDRLKLVVTGSGDLELSDLDIDEYDVNITGSGHIEIEGEDADKGYIDISGSGDVEAYDLKVNECEIDITGSGTARVNVEDYLDVRISGSGDVYYKGRPAIDQKITGSGDVVRRN